MTSAEYAEVFADDDDDTPEIAALRNICRSHYVAARRARESAQQKENEAKVHRQEELSQERCFAYFYGVFKVLLKEQQLVLLSDMTVIPDKKTV